MYHKSVYKKNYKKDNRYTMDNEIFIFIHIPKCAGTILRKNILLNYHSNEVFCICQDLDHKFAEPISVYL